MVYRSTTASAGQRHLTTLIKLACAASLSASTAFAAPYASFDARSTSMGGTGVAGAKSAGAASLNPALLSMQRESDDFQLALGAGAVLGDENEIREQVDDLSDEFDTFDAAIKSNNYTGMSQSAQRLRLSLSDVNEDQVLLSASGGFAFGIPGPSLGVGITASANAYITATPHVNALDLQTLQNVSTELQNGFQPTLDTTSQAIITAGKYTPTSTMEGVGLAAAEVGLGLSHRITFDGGSQLAIGVTPKVVSVHTYHYEQLADDDTDVKLKDVELTSQHMDTDVGVVYRGADSKWQYGLVVKNLANKSYLTLATSNHPARTLQLNTQYRAGLSHITEHTTFSMDVDLKENVNTGGNDATQFAAVGVETGFSLIQLRAGYRHNLANSLVPDVATAGIGIGPIDITGVYSKNTMGFNAQFGLGW